MKYSFKDILNVDIYNNTRVMFILGKYPWFNNLVVDTLKFHCRNEEHSEAIELDLDKILKKPEPLGISDEFGTAESDDKSSGLIDFNTFMDVVSVANIHGKWFCKCDFQSLNKKQKERLSKYIKDPSINGILVVECNEWTQYKDIHKNRILRFSQHSHSIELDYPSKKELGEVIGQYIHNEGLNITIEAVNIFLTKMNRAYNDYESMLEKLVEKHKDNFKENANSKEIDQLLIKDYMKGVQNYTIEDFLSQLMKPLGTEKSDKKKIIKIMVTLEQDIGAFEFVSRLLKVVNECIEYRVLINNGYIPVGINYFFEDIIKTMPEEYRNTYKKVNEWQFRRKADIASKTSLRDWCYIRMILNSAIENRRVSDDVLRNKCKRALYEISTRSSLQVNVIDSIIGIDKIIDKDINKINRIRGIQ